MLKKSGLCLILRTCAQILCLFRKAGLLVNKLQILALFMTLFSKVCSLMMTVFLKDGRGLSKLPMLMVLWTFVNFVEMNHQNCRGWQPQIVSSLTHYMSNEEGFCVSYSYPVFSWVCIQSNLLLPFQSVSRFTIFVRYTPF